MINEINDITGYARLDTGLVIVDLWTDGEAIYRGQDELVKTSATAELRGWGCDGHWPVYVNSGGIEIIVPVEE